MEETSTAMPRLACIEGAGGLVGFIEVGLPAEPEIDRHEHQSRTMRDGHGEGPKAQLRRGYPRQRARMLPADKPEHAKPDDKEACRNLDLALPCNEGDQQREGKHHDQYREQMARRQRPKGGHQGARTPLHQSSRNRERPAHSRVQPVIKAARDDRQPKPGRCPVGHAQIQTDG